MKESNKISLAPFFKEFSEKYLKWFEDDPELYKLTATPKFESIQDIHSLSDHWSSSNDRKHLLVLLDDEYIGDVTVCHENYHDDGEFEFGIMIAKSEYRGKGFGKEILSQTENILRSMKSKVVTAKIDFDNEPSIKFFLKNGFQLEKKDEKLKEFVLKKYLTC